MHAHTHTHAHTRTETDADDDAPVTRRAELRCQMRLVHRDTETQSCRETETQRHKDTETKRDRDTETHQQKRRECTHAHTHENPNSISSSRMENSDAYFCRSAWKPKQHKVKPVRKIRTRIFASLHEFFWQRLMMMMIMMILTETDDDDDDDHDDKNVFKWNSIRRTVSVFMSAFTRKIFGQIWTTDLHTHTDGCKSVVQICPKILLV